jgi:hypothetical protein
MTERRDTMSTKTALLRGLSDLLGELVVAGEEVVPDAG